MKPHEEVALGRAFVYRFLACAFRHPDRDAVEALSSPPPTAELATELAELARRAGPAWVRFASALDALRDEARELDLERLRTEWGRAFGHAIPREYPPFETEFTSAQTFLQSSELGDIAGFYSAFGVQARGSKAERADGIAAELEFLSLLATKEALAIARGRLEQAEVCLEASRRFIESHLGRWALAFAQRVREKSGSRIYASLATALEEWLRADLAVLEVAEPRQPGEPALLRARLPIEEAAEALEAAESE